MTGPAVFKIATGFSSRRLSHRRSTLSSRMFIFSGEAPSGELYGYRICVRLYPPRRCREASAIDSSFALAVSLVVRFRSANGAKPVSGARMMRSDWMYFSAR